MANQSWETMLAEGQEAFGAITKAQEAVGATKLQCVSDWAWALHMAAQTAKGSTKKALDALAEEILEAA